MTHLEISIHGYLVGQIWMPVTECYKPLSYNITNESKRITGGKVTLRDHVLRATNDGDFQFAAIADGFLRATYRKQLGSRMVTVERDFDLSMFPSISDCVKTDWQGPSCEEYE
jgi:hypothetical protein